MFVPEAYEKTVLEGSVYLSKASSSTSSLFLCSVRLALSISVTAASAVGVETLITDVG
jgi:hypothetical protein